ELVLSPAGPPEGSLMSPDDTAIVVARAEGFERPLRQQLSALRELLAANGGDVTELEHEAWFWSAAGTFAGDPPATGEGDLAGDRPAGSPASGTASTARLVAGSATLVKIAVPPSASGQVLSSLKTVARERGLDWAVAQAQPGSGIVHAWLWGSAEA